MNKIKQYFDIVSQDYASRSGKGMWRWVRKWEGGAIKQLIGTCPLKHVLDLGSGSGFYSNYLYSLKCQSITCVDFSEKMLEQLHVPGSVNIVADIQEFVDEYKYDLILCAGVLEFLEEPDKIFDNVVKMLNFKGAFILLLPRVSVLGRFYQMFHSQHGINVRLFYLKEILLWAEKVGLCIERKKAPLFSYAMKFTKSF